MLEEKVYTVSELTEEIKLLIESNFPPIYVEGEISNLKESPSGHYFFTLKDEKSQIEAILFYGRSRLYREILKDGKKVICFGFIRVYGKRGIYQLEVLNIEETGIGDIYKKFEEIKRKLEKEGLFDEKKKRPLPELPKKIGIVTSPRGAAIRDILNVIKRRFGRFHIIIYPCRVQGELAPDEIVKGIEFFNTVHKVDLIIVTRGGGSYEDLWAFNEESVARAIFKSEIPIISAVGHQRDFTIADFVADIRAETPTAAAEIIISKQKDLENRLNILTTKMAGIFSNIISLKRAKFDNLNKRLELRDPRRIIYDLKIKTDELLERMINSIRVNLKFKKEKISSLKSKLKALSPYSILERGYAICQTKDGKILKHAFEARENQEVIVKLYSGSLLCKIKRRNLI